MKGGFFPDSVSQRKAVSLLWYWVPPIAYAALIFYLSSLPHPEETIPGFWSVEMLGDKTLHMIEYGFFGILCFRAFRHAGGLRAAHYAPVLAIVTAVLYGVTDEMHQFYVPFRESSGWDVLADSVGACVAVLTWRAIVELKEKSGEATEGYQA